MLDTPTAPDHAEAAGFVVPGRRFALAYLAVALATSSIKESSLYRSVLVDVHGHGVILAATDAYWMARAFVPFDPAASASWVPRLEEVPADRFVIADTDWRVRDMLRYVEKRTRGIDDPSKDVTDVDVAITRGVTIDPDPDVPMLDPTMGAPQILVEIPGEERIVVRESDAEYPPLESLARLDVAPKTRLRFPAQLVQSVAQACTRVGALAMKLNPTDKGPTAWEADYSGADSVTVPLAGVLMPLRDEDPNDGTDQ